jgi:hypothetical protein
MQIKGYLYRGFVKLDTPFPFLCNRRSAPPKLRKIVTQSRQIEKRGEKQRKSQML